jgi:hypothetical protein
LSLYGIDTSDPSLYDLVIHIRKISVNDAVNLICHTAKLPHFGTTPESREAMENAVLAARVESMIVREYPDSEVSAQDGIVVIHTEGPLEQQSQITERISAQLQHVAGVKEIRVHVRPTSFF